jgi:molybdopterin-guanine dinucleotide biosynthesis protein MobB
MKLFGIVGWKNQGKTTLIVGLVREFRNRGITVATVKHAHHGFDVDKPGKDSYRQREAGAGEVLVASSRRWALMHENEAEGEPDLDHLLTRLSPADLVLVEGFKHQDHPKIEVVLAEQEDGLLAGQDATIRAVATNDPDLVVPKPVLSLDAVPEIADFIRNHAAPMDTGETS